MKKLQLKIDKINAPVFRKFLKILDHPGRNIINSPVAIVEHSGIKPGSSVIEIGCGSGYFTKEISKQVGPDGSIISIDIHPEAIASTTQKIYENALVNTTALTANAEDTKLPDSCFDMALIYGVLPTPFISTEQLLNEMHRILKNKGKIAFWCGPFKLNIASIEKNNIFKLVQTENSVYIFEKV
ncbi:MAG: class I SAM-dependent methyltransferase [Spirochaetes bacterium]|nr:class I SAM-dependent methyltransferase [Spirochaetota bacterium]